MKLWRKLSKKEKDGTRTGRSIKHQMQMAEMIGKQNKITYPLLDTLFERAGIRYTLSKKQQETLKKMAEEAAAQEASKQTEEKLDETK